MTKSRNEPNSMGGTKKENGANVLGKREYLFLKLLCSLPLPLFLFLSSLLNIPATDVSLSIVVPVIT